MTMTHVDYNKMRNLLADELTDLILTSTAPTLDNLQPLSFVATQAALAAACVLVSFEVGYLMTEAEKEN